MKTAGIISKVDEPTQWCAGMVIVPKKSGEVQICVDLKPLNENVLREVHPSRRNLGTACRTPFSLSWMPTAGSGRSHWPRNLTCSRLS